jgi:hypothetical protein
MVFFHTILVEKCNYTVYYTVTWKTRVLFNKSFLGWKLTVCLVALNIQDVRVMGRMLLVIKESGFFYLQITYSVSSNNSMWRETRKLTYHADHRDNTVEVEYQLPHH